MAVEVRQFQVTTPAGQAIASPLITSLAMPARTVRHIRVRIPPGPRGNLGFSIGMTGVPVIPINVGTWIVADDEVMEWDVDNAPSSGAWQLISYNLGKLPHTVYLQFNLDLPPGQSTAATPLSPVTVTA